MPLEFVYNKLKTGLRKLEASLQRMRYGYIDKLPAEISYFEGGLYDAVYETSCKHPYSTALQYFDVDISYKDLIKKIDKVARSLKALGIEKGDYVTICMPNTPESVYSIYAVNEIGAIANMVHPLSSENEIKDHLNLTKSKVILAIDIAYSKVEAIVKDTSVEKIVVVSASRSMTTLVRFLYWLTSGRKNHIKKSQTVLTWDRFLMKSGDFLGNPHAHVDAKDPALVMYSGGTTGAPKGIVLTNLNLNAQALGAKYLVPELVKSDYTFLAFLPNFHAFGLGVCIHLPLYFGATSVLIPQFKPKKLKKYLKKYKINIFIAVPTVFDFFMKQKFGKKELKNIKCVVSGGDIVNAEMKSKLNNFLHEHGSSAVLQNGYGLTEASGGFIFSPKAVAEIPDGIGYPIPDNEVIIMDVKTEKRAKVGETGEILVRGLSVMKEYLASPKATKEAFIKVDGKKYLQTGDLGYVDEKGVFHFRGRLKRMIISNGYNIYPSTVEQVTSTCPGVSAAAVIGKPDKLRGEKVVVFLVLEDGASAREVKKSLSKLWKKNLAKYEIPRETRILDELPKTKLAKVDYRALENL